MSSFAQSLFSGSPFLRWTLGTVALACALGFPFLFGDARGAALIIALGLELLALLLLVAMIAPERCAWAGRLLAGLVFLTYVAYLANMVWTHPESLEATAHRGESSAFNALLGLGIIGLPSLKYALTGRLFKSAEAIDPDGARDARD